MKEVKIIATELAKGNVEVAADLNKRLNPPHDVELEILEVARQAIIVYLKKGDVYRARQAKKLFGLPQDLIDETVKQAVLSTLVDGNMKRVIELKEELPVKKLIADQIVEYCISWGKKDKALALQAVFA